MAVTREKGPGIGDTRDTGTRVSLGSRSIIVITSQSPLCFERDAVYC